MGRPTAFPPIEIDNSATTFNCSSSEDTAPYLSEEVRCRLERAAQDACQPLRVRDYALMDVRVDFDGHARVAGVSPQCDLAPSGDYARSAAAAGVDYVQLVNRIAELAYERARTAAADPVDLTRSRRLRHGDSYPISNSRADIEFPTYGALSQRRDRISLRSAVTRYRLGSAFSCEWAFLTLDRRPRTVAAERRTLALEC